MTGVVSGPILLISGWYVDVHHSSTNTKSHVCTFNRSQDIRIGKKEYLEGSFNPCWIKSVAFLEFADPNALYRQTDGHTYTVKRDQDTTVNTLL